MPLSGSDSDPMNLIFSPGCHPVNHPIHTAACTVRRTGATMAVIEPAAPTRRAAPPSLDQIRPRLAAFCAGHGITRAIVFGSYARGTQTRRSDLDLVIVMDTQKRFLDRYDDVKAIHDHVPDVHVEMLIYTEDELRAIAHRPFIRRILREGIVIHE